MLGEGTTSPLRIYTCISDSVDSLPLLGAPQDIWIRPMGEEFDGQQFRATGRQFRKVIRRLRLTLRTRSNLDKVGEATAFLTRETGSHLALEDAVIDALDEKHLFDASNNQLTTDPMEVVNLAESQYIPEQKGWGASVLYVDVPYWRLMSTAVT